MKFGAIATNLAERIAFALGKVPIPLVDSIHGPMKARALLAGVRLGVFAALHERPRTAEELAPALGLDADALELLLRVLVLSDYLTADGERYALSKMARRFLVPGSAHDLTGLLRWNHWVLGMVAHMEEVVRTGRGVDYHAELTDPDAWSVYQKGMLELARREAPVLAKRVPVRRGATRLLDLGGSHGLFGAALCRRHPGLRAIVLDLPPALAPARELARAERIDDVVEHRAGDFTRDHLGSDWDVVLLCNVLHHFLPDAIAAILRRVHTALRPGGTVAIWEIERPPRGSKPGVGDGAALFFRITSTAGAYHASEYGDWIHAARFAPAHAHRPLLAPGSVLVTATKETLTSTA